VLGSPKFPLGRRDKSSFEDLKAEEVSGFGERDKYQVRSKGRERKYWIGAEVGMLEAMCSRAKLQQVSVQINKWEWDIIS